MPSSSANLKPLRANRYSAKVVKAFWEKAVAPSTAKAAAEVVTAARPSLPCGCDGEHTKDTCSEFFDHVPEAEIGEEYTEVRDG